MSNVQTMFTEIRTANALSTNQIKGNREFIETTSRDNREFMQGMADILAGQQGQITEVLRLMAANLSGQSAPPQLQLNMTPPQATPSVAAALAVTAPGVAAGATAAANPSAAPGPVNPGQQKRPVEVMEDLGEAHKKLMAVTAKKFEKKLAAFIRLGERVARTKEDINILQKGEYPPGMKATKICRHRNRAGMDV